jgi:hypothetical protein
VGCFDERWLLRADFLLRSMIVSNRMLWSFVIVARQESISAGGEEYVTNSSTIRLSQICARSGAWDGKVSESLEFGICQRGVVLALRPVL